MLMTESRSYHHGNLRESLVNAAREVVEQDGYHAVSLRELAQKLEVSRGAPYRHFADRDALLKAVAADGFSQLLETHAAVARAQCDDNKRVQLAGRAFLAFTEEHPRLFMLMFESGLLSQSTVSDELGIKLLATYQAVGSTVSTAMPGADEGKIRLALITMWSTLYGFARLRLESNLMPYMYSGLSKEQIEDAVISAAFSCLC
jgi:AcrR family transcriptional regulator